MAISVNWDNEQDTLLRYDFVGSWNWNDLSQANLKAFRMMTAVDHEVNVIFNMAESAGLPVGALNNMRQMFDLAPINMGTIVLTHSDTVAAYTFEMLSAFEDAIGTRLAIADTLETARDMFSEEWALLLA